MTYVDLLVTTNASSVLYWMLDLKKYGINDVTDVYVDGLLDGNLYG